MTWLSAPAVKLLASHCAACAHPLLDAVSIELGMGPDCRAKYFTQVPGEKAEARAAANKLVYLIAAKQNGPEVAEAISQIAALGFTTLAARITERVAKIRITVEGKDSTWSGLTLKAPYSEEAVAFLRAVPGRQWDKKAKLTRFPLSSKAALWAALKKAYPGMLAHGPNGFFTVGATSGIKAATPAASHKPSSTHVETAAEIASRHTLPLPTKHDMTTEAEMMRIEAEGDRAQTLREEQAKHAAREEMEKAPAKPAPAPTKTPARQLTLAEIREKYTSRFTASA